MIDPATGMKAGERYTIDSLERTRHFPGFFLDGKYYLGPELMTAIGWLEGKQFYYDELDPTGEPVFPDRLAGTVEDLTLTLADGARLPLNEMPYRADVDSPASPSSLNPSPSRNRPAPASDQLGVEGVRMSGKHPYPILLAAGAALMLGILLGVKQANRLPARKRR
ncbi:short chain dehydrogenase [Pseudomonas paraglycinae]|uniref:short chain dehydrogenase n=1 Tax=Pseudomonas paraglycinae TaxID=2892330 RepID=UPI0035A21CA4